jgi:hypothetical protein
MALSTAARGKYEDKKEPPCFPTAARAKGGEEEMKLCLYYTSGIIKRKGRLRGDSVEIPCR